MHNMGFCGLMVWTSFGKAAQSRRTNRGRLTLFYPLSSPHLVIQWKNSYVHAHIFYPLIRLLCTQFLLKITGTGIRFYPLSTVPIIKRCYPTFIQFFNTRREEAKR